MTRESPITASVLAWAIAEDARPLVDIADAVKLSESELD